MRKRTGRVAVLGALLAAGVLCVGATAAHAAKLVASTQTGDPGATVTFTVSLTAEGASVAGTQNDVTFDAVNTPVAAKANGKPNCTVNPDIDKAATSFAFRPNGCSGATCTAVRALVLSTDNTTAVPDGAVLYTCTANIAAAAAAGSDHALTLSGIILSDPAGVRVADPTSTDGNIHVTGTTSACPAPKAPPAGPAIYVTDERPAAPGTVTVSAKLAAGSAQVAGTQNDIGFDPAAPIAAKANGKPNCTVNPDIDKAATSFAFRPNACSGATCTAVRALVLSTDNTTAIPDGSVLYTCSVDATTAPAGTNLPLTVTGIILSDPAGVRVANATGQDGSVCIGGGPPPATATPTETILLPTATPTNTIPPPTATATKTNTPVTPVPQPSAALEDEGGCQIGAMGGSSNGWFLLIPAAALLVMRRRSR